MKAALLFMAALVAICSARVAVRVAHASSDAPAVDVYVNGTRAFADVRPLDVIRYAILPAATYNFRVVPAGQQSPVVIDATVDLKDGTPYTVAAINRLANIAPQVFVDDSEFPPVGQALIRFVHLSPDAPAVDIAVKNGPTLFKGTPAPSSFLANPSRRLYPNLSLLRNRCRLQASDRLHRRQRGQL